jgi:RNA 3'-terminal phosphate cyclase
VLVYAALANGTSTFVTTKELEMHTQTMIVLLPMFCDTIITTEQRDDHTVVSIKGVGLINN